MIRSRKKLVLVALALTIALVALLMPAPIIDASDHIDGPQLANDHASDINDMWFFLDPNDPASRNTDPADNPNVVMIMTINPFLISSEIIGQAIFDHNIRYRFEIENTGDASPDRFVDVRFDRYVGRELEPGQLATITLPDGRTFTARVPPPTQGDDVADTEPPPLTVTNDAASRASFYAGAADDPFFLDNTAANRFVLSSVRSPGNPNRAVFRNRAGFDAADGSAADADAQVAGQLPSQPRNLGLNQGAGRDTYSGFSTLTIAVSVPASMLRGSGNVLGLNGVTQRQRFQAVQTNGQVVGSGAWVTVDREGVPLVNNGLIPPPLKDQYNGASTANDARDFRAAIDQALQNFGTDAVFRARILDLVNTNGDILRLNLAVPNSGAGGGNNTTGGPANMGGRRLQDDVVDATFTLINNGVPLGDFVDRNDFVFGDSFPFVAPQVMPNPNGINNSDVRIRL